MALADLLSRWVTRADELAPYAAPAAEAFRRAARELEAEIDGREAVAVSPTEAAKVTHYHPESICRMIRAGRVKNYGTKRRPLVRIEELPHKAEPTPRGPGKSAQVAQTGEKGSSSVVGSIARDAVADRMGRR